MVLVFIISIFILYNLTVEASKEIIVETPFYLRARILDSHTASVQFEIEQQNDQRTCQMYQFTVRRNREHPYSMSQQNLTFWRNSLELKHLAAGHYQVCAIICSEHLPQAQHHYSLYQKKNRTAPVTACIHFDAFRHHLLVLTLYVLVVMFLTISQIIFSLRKRQFQARIKVALIEVENSLQKWRSAQASSATTTTDQTQSCTILQSLVTIPASPVEHSVSSLATAHTSEDDEQPHPVVFHLESLNE